MKHQTFYHLLPRQEVLQIPKAASWGTDLWLDMCCVRGKVNCVCVCVYTLL
uniref:Uncharacterized protein MANES_11G025600 n=1 Tax=Rhizophora mucronata TaxID=61149 RepID=A0A2P2NG25_RHIMU